MRLARSDGTRYRLSVEVGERMSDREGMSNVRITLTEAVLRLEVNGQSYGPGPVVLTSEGDDDREGGKP